MTRAPFWSAIIVQQARTWVVGIGVTDVIDIRPPPNETWWIHIDMRIDGGRVEYYVFDGVTETLSTKDMNISTNRILTHTLYARMKFVNTSTSTRFTACYGYSGFKLSRPLYSPVRDSSERRLPWKRSLTQGLPKMLEPLEKYIFEVKGVDPSKPEEYGPVVILEEDTPLAIDPITGFVIEKLTSYVPVETFMTVLTSLRGGKMKLEASGYKKYIDKWKAEGIELL